MDGTKKIIFKQGDTEYELGKGIGSWAFQKDDHSYKVNFGDVRRINGVLMYAYTIYRKNFLFGKDEINWCPVDETFNTYENLRKWLGNNG